MAMKNTNMEQQDSTCSSSTSVEQTKTTLLLMEENNQLKQQVWNLQRENDLLKHRLTMEQKNKNATKGEELIEASAAATTTVTEDNDNAAQSNFTFVRPGEMKLRRVVTAACDILAKAKIGTTATTKQSSNNENASWRLNRFDDSTREPSGTVAAIKQHSNTVAGSFTNKHGSTALLLDGGLRAAGRNSLDSTISTTSGVGMRAYQSMPNFTRIQRRPAVGSMVDLLSMVSENEQQREEEDDDDFDEPICKKVARQSYLEKTIPKNISFETKRSSIASSNGGFFIDEDNHNENDGRGDKEPQSLTSPSSGGFLSWS